MRTITREELYAMVWSEPTVKVAKGLSVSDVAVGKLCKKLAVPKPPLGYWAKKAAGKPVRQIPLPPLSKGGVAEAALTSRPAVSVPTIDDTELKRFASRVPEPDPNFNVRSAPWEMLVGQDAKRRAAGIAAVIDQMLRDQGATVIRQRNQQQYELMGQVFSFKVEEVQETVVVGHKKPDIKSMSALQREYARRLGTDKPTPITRRQPTGKLVLSVTGLYSSGHQQTWSDTKQRLEQKISSVVVGVLRLVHLCKEREDSRREEEKREFERQRPIALRTLRKEHLAFVLGKWREAFELRRFIADVEQHVGDRPRKEPELREWLEWLRAYADEVDPVASERFFIPFSDEQVADEVGIGGHMFKPARPWEANYEKRDAWLEQDDED